MLRLKVDGFSFVCCVVSNKNVHNRNRLFNASDIRFSFLGVELFAFFAYRTRKSGEREFPARILLFTSTKYGFSGTLPVVTIVPPLL